MIRRVYEDAWFVVDHNPQDRVYRCVRTPERYGSVAQISETWQGIERALATVVPGSFLLYDTRDAIPRNDPEFEAAVIPLRERAFARFSRVAILVRTAVGKLQVQRLNQGVPATVKVFDDEDAAFDFLLD